jgi:carbamoyltransferase
MGAGRIGPLADSRTQLTSLYTRVSQLTSWVGENMRVLGINMRQLDGHHDASACLVDGGRIVAFAEEERFSRRKHAFGQQASYAVSYCLEQAGLTLDDVDYIATPWFETGNAVRGPAGSNPEISFALHPVDYESEHLPDFALDALSLVLPGARRLPPVVHVSHHLAHAASAYRCALFEESAILVIDGEGDRVSTTIARGANGCIEPIAQFPISSSLGHFYEAVTAFIGFGHTGQGKAMGLAPYGRPVHAFDEIKLHDEGYEIDLAIDDGRCDPVRGGWRGVGAAWQVHLDRRFGPPNPSRMTIDPDSMRPRDTTRWRQRELDIVASAQLVLEKTLCHLASIAVRESGSARLLLAGGVALNCSANGAIRRLPFVEDLFVQPIAGDAGAALGAALEVSAWAGCDVRSDFTDVALGPEFSDDQIVSILRGVGVSFTAPDDICDVVARLLARDKVLGWFQGRMEGGPRALGRRSILAPPQSEELRDRTNDVKRRARWRPLAPAVRVEEAERLLDSLMVSPYMIVSDQVRADIRHAVSGIVHVDGSTRPQTVDRARNAPFWELLTSFQSRVGLPCVINTSFNDEAEPIVCTPYDALRTYFSTDLDALAIGSFLLCKDRG